jgi:hypothetical protein
MGIQIKHLAGTQESIDDDTPIIRYMKLSTLLLLLADRVFLPSLRCLQSDDKYEGLMPQRVSVHSRYGKALRPQIKEFEQWLLQHSKGAQIASGNAGRQNTVDLAKIWLEQLSIRRCVWCWNKHTGLSHALWKIYGQRGVALISTIGQVKRAFQGADRMRAIVSPVNYSIPQGLPNLEEFFAGSEAASIEMSRKENLPFPYLFKDAGYRYEEEVRFVFGVHLDLLIEGKGVVAEIDGKSIVRSHVDCLRFSPDIPKEEQTLIRYLVTDIHKESFPSFPYPAEQDKVRLARFRKFGGSPFSAGDKPAGLFVDLD